jgi:hypothetical protein
MAERQQSDFLRVPKSESIQGALHIRSSEAAKTNARTKGEERDFESISILAEAKEGCR